MGGCAHKKTYAQAVDICTKAKARLCTQSELYSSCTRGPGCGHDADLIWAGTTVLELCHECHDKARDNKRTKWLDFKKKPIIFFFASPVVVSSYKWQTANDASDRDPTRWAIEGSNDGKAWKTIDDTYLKKDATVPKTRYQWVGPFAVPVKGALGRPCTGDSKSRTDAMTRYTGHGVVHKIKVPLGMRLKYRIMRHLPSYNFLVAISSTASAAPTCPGMFKSCLINNQKTWSTSAYKKKKSSWAYYPSLSKGTTRDEDVYVTIQAENTDVQTNGYWIDYSVCKKGTSILGKGVVPTRGKDKKKGYTQKNVWQNCPRSN